jgi:hypothetical protein
LASSLNANPVPASTNMVEPLCTTQQQKAALWMSASYWRPERTQTRKMTTDGLHFTSLLRLVRRNAPQPSWRPALMLLSKIRTATQHSLKRSSIRGVTHQSYVCCAARELILS